MRISGFTFIRNGHLLQYPFRESIESILPICDEFVVVVGNSDDGTLETIQSIRHPCIRIIQTVWDETLRTKGIILAQQTNIALAALTGDWGFYLQADEVIHERDLSTIQQTAYQYREDETTDGLLFHWLHFFGNYDYVAVPGSRGVYSHEVRMIKLGRNILSYGDAQGFRRFPEGPNGPARRLRVRPVNATVYHYGKVRGPEAEQQRLKSFVRWWHSDQWAAQHVDGKQQFDYTCSFPLQRFTGTHPAVMHERMARTQWPFSPQRANIRIPLTYRILNAVYRHTGLRPFEFRNYRRIR